MPAVHWMEGSSLMAVDGGRRHSRALRDTLHGNQRQPAKPGSERAPTVAHDLPAIGSNQKQSPWRTIWSYTSRSVR